MSQDSKEDILAGRATGAARAKVAREAVMRSSKRMFVDEVDVSLCVVGMQISQGCMARMVSGWTKSRRVGRLGSGLCR